VCVVCQLELLSSASTNHSVNIKSTAFIFVKQCHMRDIVISAQALSLNFLYFLVALCIHIPYS
jgi:hypothetical protein